MLNLSKIKKHKIVSIILLIILAYGYYFFNKEFGFSVPCIFHTITGYYCPGCGITRMIFSLLKLDIYQAFRYNPLVFILGILFVIYMGICFILKRKITIPQGLYIALIVIIVIYGIIRNIPLFSYLKPTVV